MSYFIIKLLRFYKIIYRLDSLIAFNNRKDSRIKSLVLKIKIGNGCYLY